MHIYHKRIWKIYVQCHSLPYLSYTMYIGIQFYCRRKLDYSENMPGITANCINKVLRTQAYGLLCTRPTRLQRSWIFVVLTNWNTNSWVDMSLLSDTLSWLRAVQSFLLLLNAACLADIQQMSVPGEGCSTHGRKVVYLGREVDDNCMQIERSYVKVIEDCFSNIQTDWTISWIH